MLKFSTPTPKPNYNSGILVCSTLRPKTRRIPTLFHAGIYREYELMEGKTSTRIASLKGLSHLNTRPTGGGGLNTPTPEVFTRYLKNGRAQRRRLLHSCSDFEQVFRNFSVKKKIGPGHPKSGNRSGQVIPPKNFPMA